MSEDVEMRVLASAGSTTNSDTTPSQKTPTPEDLDPEFFNVPETRDDDGSSIDELYLENPSKMALFKRKARRFWSRVWTGPAIPYDEPPVLRSEYLQQFEAFPGRISRSFPFKIKLPFILIYYTFWLIVLRQALAPYLTEQPRFEDETTHEPVDIISISCRREQSIWKGKNAFCGLNGDKCKPFENREVVFRCPALCDSESITYSSITVGNDNVKYRDFYVGGGKSTETDSEFLSEPYRADSFPCGAAVHAGVLSPYMGGCARIRFTGFQSEFNASASQYHSTDDSVAFDSFFPASYRFVQTPEKCHNCYDPRVLVALINILLGLPVMLMSVDGQFAFWTVCISGFWTIVLIFDPPKIVKAQDPESLASLVSLGFERFLPLCFMLYVVWKFACQTTLSSPSSPLCKTLVWYPLFWVGMLNNVTFDRLPVDRLTLTDIMTQPGSLTATLAIVGVISTGVVVQAYQLWAAGKFRRYLAVYLTFVAGLVVLGNVHGLNLRIHHYILALLLLPGTNTKGWTAILFQGVLLGLLVNGVSRWGLASVLETDRSLRRSDPTGEIKPPKFVGFEPTNSSLSWKVEDAEEPKMINGEFISPHDKLTKYSLLINDVERYNGGNTSVSIEALSLENKEFGDELKEALRLKDDVKLYLRVARAGGNRRSDYTNAAILKYPAGDFVQPKRGVTK